MMIVPTAEMFMKTSTLLVPTATSTHHASDTAFPTVIPDLPIFEHAGTTGYRTLWAVFVLLVLSSAAFAGLSWNVPVSKRYLHVLTTTATLTSALAYFGLATKQGITWHVYRVVVHNEHVPNTVQHFVRPIAWAHYVDWLITGPLLLAQVSFLAGLDGAHTLITIAANTIFVLGGLFSAFATGHKGAQWGWYTISAIAYFVVLWQLFVNGRAHAAAQGNTVSRFFLSVAIYTSLVWAAYPITGTRVLSVNHEIIAYAVLDLLAKPIFGAWLLTTYSKVPEIQAGLGGFWSRGLDAEGRIRIADDEDGA
ncbi:family A G protein-coupled receptor-like protein [Trichodelitschia bisporula]|uniref:Family A G protein-coupled receptor-like protein n=1 Tax=Trichodelitschia bisporula TaxID=703511 RepID=A0A6G1I320_9PEZI|nr:family A G protein-coupled receptor-like protein [Trichodelitschia bisporula]